MSNWYSLNKIAFMQLNRSVLEPMIQYLIQCNNYILDNNLKRIGTKTFPIKKFNLSLYGTPYQFLMRPDLALMRDVGIQVTVGSRQNSYMTWNNGRPVITMNFQPGWQVSTIYATLQHQVLHVIQYMIKAYRMYILKHKLPPIGQIGGLPKKRFMDKRFNDHGIPLNQKGQKDSTKRTHHSLRPVQRYPDLNSLVRQLQIFWFKNNKQKYPNKLLFLKKFLDSQIPELSSLNKDLQKFRSISQQVYNAFIKKLYVQFMEKPWNFTQQQIVQLSNSNAEAKSLNKINQQKKKILLRQKDLAQKSKVHPVVAQLINGKQVKANQFDSISRIKFEFSAFDLSQLQDGNQDWVLYVIDKLPYIKEVQDKWGGQNRIVLYLPKGFASLISFLAKVKQLKQTIKQKENLDYFVRQIMVQIKNQFDFYIQAKNQNGLDLDDFLRKYYY